jgi:Putative zinc-finger
MTEFFCGYGDNRDAALVAFLYDDADASPAERALFDAHLQTCARCRADVAALRGVRTQLARWSPPEPINLQSTINNQQSRWWRDIPAWAQVAAALLFLGVSAGVANLDVRYDQNGLSVRTGWLPASRETRVGEPKPASVVAQPPSQDSGEPRRSPQDQQASGGGAAPWRADLAALERQLKTELHAAQVSAVAPAPAVRAASTTDADVSRAVRALVVESEKRQQRELALRIAELLRDVGAQRQADLVKIDRTLGVVQNNVGVEVMKNRQQINQMDLLYRASQRQ